MRRLAAIILFMFALAGPASAQLVSMGQDPVNIRWKSLETNNFRIVYPAAADSLAKAYARSLESFVAAQKAGCGFSPNELYKRRMPVILHAYSATSNGIVTWAPRRMEFFTSADFYNPESTPWMEQLTVHEGRHAAQMQFSRKNKLFRPLEWFIGDLAPGAAAGLYPGPALMEGDAVVAETALSQSGRGRTADFLEYYHVALSDSLYRDFWQWRYGSQKRYTPDYYRAGYVLIAGMRGVFDDGAFTARYFNKANKRFLTYNVLDKTVIESSGRKKNLYSAFNTIQDSFRAEWAAADSARAPFIEGRDLVKPGRLYDEYTSLLFADGELFALHSSLDRAREMVRIDTAGRVERLGAFATESSRLAYDPTNRRLVWSEYKPSALLDLKSWSIIRYSEDGGSYRSFTPEGRLYNPAPAGDRPIIAAVQEYEDGTYSVRLFASNHLTPFEEYMAPCGLLPVEVAWIGEALYASGITKEGFSIYHLPDWKPLFEPAHSKINRLFGRDGLLWFTSDRSGVNELHSLDPPGGQILQRTSLRFGGNDFAFAPDSSLYYSAPTAKGRVVRVLPADALLEKPVEFGGYPSSLAEQLSAQEPVKEMPYEGPVSEGKPYSKILQPVHVHSWAPMYVEYNPVERLSLEKTQSPGNLGAMLMFQNELGTAWGSVGVSLLSRKDTLGTGYQLEEGAIGLPVEWRPALHAQYVWNAWGPIVELRADYNERNVHVRNYTRVSTEKGMSFPEKNSIGDDPLFSISAGFSIPFNLNGGGWKRGIVPSYRFNWSNDRYSSLDVAQYTNTVVIRIVPHNSLFLSTFSLRGYAMRPVASSGIFPRYGLGAEAGFTRTHNIGSNQPGYYYAKVYGYLPGLMSTHGLRFLAQGQSNYGWEGSWIKKQEYMLAADYAFPFLPLDWSGACPYFYFRNFEAVLHAGATLGAYEELLRTIKDSYVERYAGATLRAHLGNFLMIPYETYIGARYVYNFDSPDRSGVELVFSMDM